MEILPIGTVVKVGYDDNLYMIISRYLLTTKNNTVGYCDYTACIYPLGIIPNEDPYFFNHEDIVEVIFEGFVNPQEERLQKYYSEKLESIKYPRLNIYE